MLEESKEMEEEGELDDLLLPQCKIKRNYTCTHCTYYTQNPRSYLYHLRDEHQEKIRIYECPHCLYASKHSQKLQRHVHMVHVMGKGRTKKPAPLKVKKTPAPPPPPVDPSVPSPEEEEEDGDGEYRCSLCTFTSKSKTLVTRHEHLVHLKKKFFRCIKCNYVTHMRARYTKHVKYHSMPMIKCDLCDFRTPYKWNLDRHYKNHTGDGAFRCSLCNFTADIKQSLTVHEMNHHVPPVGQTPGAIGLGVGGGRRRNKVGASDTTAAEADIDQDELELLRLEREDEDEDAGMQTHLLTDKEARLAVGAIRRSPKIKMTAKKIKSLTTQVQNERHNFRTDFIHPDDIIHHKNGNVYIKNLKCRLCNFKAAWEGEMARHENKVHGVHRQTAAKTPPKKVPRPIPNLIPIQNKAPTSSVLPILRIPSVRARSSSLVKQVSPSNSLSLTQETSGLSEKDLNEICAKSCPNSALKDFASLIGGEDAFKTQEEPEPSQEPEETPQDTSLSEKPASPPGTFKKKNASFFDKLKEKLLVGAGAGETCNLVCAWCGHESKCLSELVRHQKQHTNGSGDSASGPGCTVTQPSGAELSSTRCQRCRQRCKTSADLLVHLQSCTASGNQEAEVSMKAPSKEEHDLEQNPTIVLDVNNGFSSELDPEGKCNVDIKRDPATDSDPEPEPEPDHTSDPEPAPGLEVKSGEVDMGPHPMENKVFVWNSLPQPMETESEEDPSPTSQPTQSQTKLDEDSRDMSVRSKSPISDGSMVGVETTPGYGAITSKTSEMNVPSDASGRASPPIFKKVFKCPHCSFWASTASRFHVHIVGHLNKKPFECSLCAYRSNWRWDITKHIRLKSARDISHERARVLMTDETGRRNYSKYNKFLQFMRVHESTAESSGSGRRSQRELSQGTAVPLEGGIYQQQPLPAPPRLTRAPTPSSRNTNMPMLLPGTLRPPPPLKAAHPGLLPNPPPLQPQRLPPPPLQEEPEDHTKRDLKRPAKMPFGQEPQVKRPAVEGKKTLWKCKKCNYRDSSRELVLAHVKEHYQQRLQAQGAAADSSEASVGRGHSLFRCGHCHQVSNWKHVIQRHCRLKHSGDVRVVMGQRRANVGDATDVADTTPHEEEEDEEEETAEIRKCENCPFTCSSSLELNTHLAQHIPRPGAIFKCYFCPYYVNHKRDLLEHMSLHGVQEPEEYVSKAAQEKKLPSRSPDKETTEMSQLSLSGCDSSPNKRYKCVGCPYVSNSKSQFLYHKQFHRPRGAPFKCGLCSYNVSRRHLLHQHLRVHGILIPPQKSPSKPSSKDEVNEIEEVSSASMPLACSTPLDTRTMMEIPLVWVSREGKFSKMFKCRYCPHVNLRKANIQEHEKMHRVRTKNLSEALDAAGRDVTGKMKEGGTGPSPQVQQHRCPDCNYVCNNAGVLSSHAKVHQGMYGQVHCLVDASRSDEAQLEELNASIVGSEVEMKMSPVFQNDRRSSVEEGKAVQELDHSTDVTLGNTELGITSDSDTNNAHIEAEGEKETKLLFFCSQCPARFLFAKELNIHVRFHEVRLAHRCESCTYTARQRPHLLAHLKVHTDDYQEKTNTLVKMYETSEKHPRPRSAVIVEGPGVSGPVWVVISGGTQVNTNPAEEAPSQVNKKSYEGHTKAMIKQFSCMKCPARFFKSVALQYHISLHGGSGLYKCRHCDYAVKTYGNLVKHEMIHNPSSEKIKTSPSKHKNGVVPLSGTDLFQHKSEALKQSINEIHTTHQTTVHVDPQFGILMHGNPDFIYPMYFKNGRLKEKRYKCHKCPSAFEKREQYKVHLSLHGSKQRYKCEKCDYSVKYYANYIQHMRKHQHNEDAQAARKAEKSALEPTKMEPVDDVDMQGDLLTPEDMPPLLPRCVKSISAPPQLSMADKQTMMLLEQRQCNALNSARESTEELLRKTFWCPHCPYSSQRRDGVESHIKRHIAVSGVRGNFTCVHCDYSVPQLHFLREHNKVHFGMHKKFLPEAYMKCDRIELWVQDECKENGTENTTDKIPVVNEPTDKKLVFQDNGPLLPYSERFYPLLSQDVLSDFKDNLDEEKVYVDIRTGESLSNNTFAGVVNSVALEEGACEANSASGKIDADDADSLSTTSTTDSSSSNSSSNSSSSSSSTSSSSSSTSSSSSSTSSSANEENKSASSSEENCAVVNNNEEVKSVTEDPESSSDSSVDS